MDTFREPDVDTVAVTIAALREAWLDAVRAGNAERLADMVTDDVVVVHGDGRCVHGREELKADLVKGFAVFSLEQNVSAAELVVRGRWAFEISEVESRLTPHLAGESKHVHSITVVGLNRQPDGSWKVGRVLGVLDAAPAGSR